MRVAFSIFKVFPYGGIARDLTKIVSACLARGHEVRIYAMAWEGEPVAGVHTVLLRSRGLRSHVRQCRFAAKVAEHRRTHPVDLLVGMNKMPDLDVYYAGDSCFEDKARTQRPWAYRLTPRYRHFADFERAVFAEDARTRILTIAPRQADVFRAVYGTPRYRFHDLPPGIEPNRMAGNAEHAAALRREFGVSKDDALLLFVGSGFVKKGLGRVLQALAALPSATRAKVRLVVVGTDRARRFARLARRLGLAERVCFVGGRDDVPDLLRAADAFTLPAKDEAAGMVILEAAIAGLPVLVTANCGYAPFIADADAGIVTPLPFEQKRFDADLLRLLTADERAAWARNGRGLGKDDSLYSMAPRVVDLLERFGSGREPPLVAFLAFRHTTGDPRCRDLLPAAVACRARGLNVRIYSCIWGGDVPGDIELVRVPVAAMTTAARMDRYRRWVAGALHRLPAACVIDFDGPRGMVVEPKPSSDIFADLPLGLGGQPIAPRSASDALRRNLGFAEDDVVFVMVGGDLVSQGVERLFTALGRLPVEDRERCRMLAVGRLAGSLRTAARVLGLRDRTQIIETGMFWRDAIEAGDIFVDLAYAPSSNGWIFDALAAGRAVLTHDWIGEADWVRQADGGIVLEAPVGQAECNRAALDLVTDSGLRERCQANATAFGQDPARFGRSSCLALRIEQLCRQAGTRRSAAVEAHRDAALSA